VQDGRTGREERRVNICPERLVPFLGADIDHIGISPLESGIVHGDIEPAEVFQALARQMAAMFLACVVPSKDDNCRHHRRSV
jgi:hypothetical protein